MSSLRPRHRLLLVSQGLALACVVGGAVRCSSPSSNVVGSGDDGGGSSSGSGSSGASNGSSGSGGSSGSSGGTASTSGSSGSSGGTPSTSGGGSTDAALVEEASADGGCASMDMQTLATKVTFDVQWPSTLASQAGMGTVSIWLLTKFTGTTALTGTSQSCGTTLPDLQLNDTGTIAADMTPPPDAKVQIQITNATWAKVTRTFNVNGMQSGFSIGASEDTNAAVGLVGLAQGSMYAMDTTKWPIDCPMTGCTGSDWFASTDITDDDGDGNPGITANPLNSNGYTYPPTNTTCGAPATQIYIVSRNELAVTGMRMTCTKGTGTASVTLFDNHVVGCMHGTEAAHGLCSAVSPGACAATEVAFLDDNRTKYGYDQTAGDVFSKAHPASNGVATIVALNAGATCSDVLAAVP